MRKRIYEIIEVSKDNDLVSKIYDIFMMVVIFASLIPLAFKEQTTVFLWLDKITVMIFIVDYLLRLITADYKLNSKGKAAILIYPFTPMAIIDLLSILPSMTILNSGFKLLKIFRLLRTFRVFRVFKAVRYSKNIMLILSVLKRQ